jgi:hypothetical protein
MELTQKLSKAWNRNQKFSNSSKIIKELSNPNANITSDVIDEDSRTIEIHGHPERLFNEISDKAKQLPQGVLWWKQDPLVIENHRGCFIAFDELQGYHFEETWVEVETESWGVTLREITSR